MPLGIAEVRGILPRGGTILGSSRTNPFKIDGGVERIAENLHALGVDALIAIGGEDTLGVATKLAERGVQRRRRAEDDRQRPQRHRLHVRLRHRGQHRDGGDRPAAHHGRVAPPRADRRGHGPARRLDRAARRAWPAAPTSSCMPGAAVLARAGLRLRREPLPGALRADRRRRRGRDAGRRRERDARQGRRTRSGTSGSAASASGWPARSRSAPARRPAPRCSATSSAAARRPRSTGCSPPGSGCTPSTRCSEHDWGKMVALRGTDIVRVPLAEATTELKTVDRELYAEAEVFFG